MPYECFLTDIGSLPSNNRPIVRVREGEHFILSCLLPTSIPAVTVQWQRRTTNVLTLSNNNRFSIYLNETTSLLIVSYLDTSDAETYRCLMSNDLVPDVAYNEPVAEVAIGRCDCVCLSVSMCLCMRETHTDGEYISMHCMIVIICMCVVNAIMSHNCRIWRCHFFNGTQLCSETSGC